MSENLHPGHAVLRKLIPDAEKRHEFVVRIMNSDTRPVKAKHVYWFLLGPDYTIGDAAKVAAFLNDI